jgi:DNA-binding Lrp family transcriptional regulator
MIDKKEAAAMSKLERMTLTDILEKLYEEGSFEGEHRDIHPDRIAEAKLAILEVVRVKEQSIVDIMVKEQHRNNPDRPDKHTYSGYCSCGHCLMAHLIADDINSKMGLL